MSVSSKISWTQGTWNPWTGCSKVSPACLHCYAERWSLRTNMVQWGPGQPRKRTSPSNWKQPARWNKAAGEGHWYRCLSCGHEGIRDRVNSAGVLTCLVQPEKCDPHACVRIDRPRIFSASLADWLDDDNVPIGWLADFLEVIANTPNLDWLLLTKRPENFQRRLKEVEEIERLGSHNGHILAHQWLQGRSRSNVLIGITAETHEWTAKRWQDFAAIPAQRKFLSMEPLLGPVDLDALPTIPELSWIIVGGESGPGHRDLEPAHAIQVKDWCDRKGIPFHFKQWSGNVPGKNPLWLDGQLHQPGPLNLDPSPPQC